MEINTKDDHKAAKEYLEEIIALMPGHVYWKDREGVYLGCNDLQAKSVGLSSRHDMIGKTDYDFSWAEQAEFLRNIDQQVMTSGIAQTIEEPAVLADGSQAVFLSKKVPLYSSNQEIVGVVGISFNITEQKIIEQRLRETQDKVDGMTLVSASMAHQLRTPLAGLNISTKFIKDMIASMICRMTDEIREQHSPIERILRDFSLVEKELTIMDKEIKASLTVIDMLLLNLNPTMNVSNIEIFSINDCIEDALSRYPFAPNQQKLITWENIRENNFEVKSELLLLIHTFFNLIKNSVHSILQKGEGKIEIWVQPDKNINRVYFKDTGMGISEASLPHIFDRFYSKTHHGTGIGLSFCQWVMHTLGGSIICESVEGEYALFILCFPNFEINTA